MSIAARAFSGPRVSTFSGILASWKTSLASMLCNLEAIWINTKLFDQTFLYLLSREQRLVRKRQGCPS